MAIRNPISQFPRDRKRFILIILLFILALSLVYRLLHPFKQDRVDKLTFTGQKTGRPAQQMNRANPRNGADDPFLRLDLFFDPPKHSKQVISNIFFRPSKKEATARPAPLKMETPNDSAPAIPDARTRVQEELSQFRTFGSIEQGGERILFIERGKDILVIKTGDRIDGKYTVKQITETLLTLRAEEINEDVQIDLSQF